MIFYIVGMNKVLITVFLAAVLSFAITADEALKKSKAWFGTSKSWSFDFKMTTYMADSPAAGTQQGNMLVSEGNKFKLTIPGMTLISDGTNFWQWNIEQKQVLIKLVEDLESSMHPSELLFKYLNCKALSLKEDKYKGVNVYVIKLSAKDYSEQFVEMEVWLSAKDFSPVRLFIVDDVGNSSWYDVSNLKVRKDLAEKDFKFQTAKGIDEIDMR